MPYGPPLLLASLNPNAIAAGADIPDAVTIDDATLSRSDLLGAATSVAERIARADRVAVLAEPTVRTVLAVVGCLIAGVTVVPVPPDSGAAELEHILRDSGAQAWLGAAPEGTALPVVPVRLHARSWHTYPEPDPASTAFILYTSGTTGAPKGVMLSRGAIAAGLDALAEAWDWTWKDTLVHGLPLFHVHGLILGLLGPLRVGSPVIHTGKPTPEAYVAAGGSLYFGVPTVWSRVVEQPELARQLGKARLLVSGSAPLPVPVFEKLAELTGQPPVERYGMSETMITLSTRADGERRPGWVGTPVGGVQTRLCDESGAPVPHDGESIGALQVRGPMLFDGYLNRPEATAADWTEDGWFRTGDVAVIDTDGFHRIVGRESIDLIKSGGYRIGAGEIETALLGHPAVAEVAVVGL
ncbi:acyl-CoA synthetase, partial [Nocardia sp. NPDC058497]|uniref:acyl-CoA synthetase n=1 Tax=Nocardia sp. NPDC058497 TaxID=3346529 RepID=UPI00364CCCBC